ncbi:hypothetical protein B0O99DRAFT_646758 [Bisporella sp. PMI_857]|nr:hypothetical protein B0O99DRAFT_646758 [Bisporella sp. PMI_857]
MKSFTLLSLCLLAAGAASAGILPVEEVVTVTVYSCATETQAPVLAADVQPSHVSFPVSATTSPSVTIDSSAPGASLGPVPNPNCDKSDLKNIALKKNVTLLYGSSDPTTPNTNAEIKLEMRWSSVLLEEIASIEDVVCSDSSVTVTFADPAAFAVSVSKWDLLEQFILITNHLGNCDVELERGLFLVDSVTFDAADLTVTAKSQRTDFESCAGSMQIDFGQESSTTPNNSTGFYSNSTATANAKRNINWDPTYSLSFNRSLAANTVLASYDPYVKVVANTASFASAASFKGRLSYNFWKVKVEELYFDFNLGFDANLRLTGDVNAAYQGSFTYAPDALKIAPVNIPGIIVLGPSLNLAIGVQVIAVADVTVTTHTQATLVNGVAHVDLLTKANTYTSGWTPAYIAEATADAEAAVQLNPFIQLGAELAVNFLGGLLDLSSGVKANATLTNQLTISAGAGAVAATNGTSVSIPTGTLNGVCQNGVEYKSDFIFTVVGYVTQFYSTTLYAIQLPVFDKCWTWAGPSKRGYTAIDFRA